VDSGLTLALQTILAGQSGIAADVAATRADVTRALVRLEVIEAQSKTADEFRHDVEARLRVVEARPGAPGDHEGRLRALEKFRYTVGGLALVGGVLAGWLGEWLAVHVHG
jgi:hypothetical protein